MSPQPDPAVRPALLVSLAFVLMVLACDDSLLPPTGSEGMRESVWVNRGPLLAEEDSVPCVEVEACGIVEVGGEEVCKCDLPGIAVNVPGGDGYAGPYPWNWWPDPPGFPDPDPGTWPEPPGGGTWPNLPFPGPGECNPYGFEDSCFWEAELTCTAAVTRGSVASCQLSVDPQGALDQVKVWTFNGDETNTSYAANVTTWQGTMVESGKVRVDFVAKGRDATATSFITVQPRPWTWDSSQRTFSQGSPGDLDNCFGSQVGLTADKYGCSASTPGVLINPGASQGFSVSQGGGPNAGVWYVTNPTTRSDVRTQVASRYRPDGAKQTINGVAQIVQACETAYSPNPVPPQNNHSVNTICSQTSGFSNLIGFAWDHEGQHLNLIQTAAAQPTNDIYAAWESVVGPSFEHVVNVANQFQNDIHQNLVDAALSLHNGGTTDFSMWYSTGSGIWEWVTVTVQH